MPAQRLPWPDLGPGAALRRDLLVAGVTRGQLQGPAAHRIARGLYSLRPAASTLSERVSDLLRVLPQDTVATGATALALHGAPIEPAVLSYATTWPHQVRRAGVRVARLKELPPHQDGIAHPAHAFVAAARELDLLELVTAGDRLVRLGVTTVEALSRAAETARGRGCVLARRAAALVRERVDSPRETWLRLCLVLADLPEPEVNVRIENDARFLGRPDLTYRRYRAFLEYEGDQHRVDRRQWAYDMVRYEDFAADGWTGLRIAAETARHPREVVNRTWRALRAGGYRVLSHGSARSGAACSSECADQHPSTAPERCLGAQSAMRTNSVGGPT